jgi:hypothetical protein
MIKYNLNYDEANDSSFFNEYFANELSFDASQTLSLILIENDAQLNHSNDNSQLSEFALNAWKDEKFSNELFSDENNRQARSYLTDLYQKNWLQKKCNLINSL